MKIFEPDFADLGLDIREVYRTMGQGDHAPGDEIVSIVSEIIEESSVKCRALAGYKILPVKSVSRDNILIGGTCLKTGKIIASYFTGAEYVAVFVATCGEEFEAWLHELKLENDIFREFVADAVGSEIAEAASRYAGLKIEEEAALSGAFVSNSYSPGYCGWHVREQKSLFGLLPDCPCGISLNESCLMTPVKSVSGIVGIGRDIEKAAYGCDICNKKDCYKKRTA